MKLCPSRTALLAVACLTTTGMGGSAPGERDGDELRVVWMGEELARADVARRVGSAPARAVEAWGDWAARGDYELHLDPTGRVLFAAPAGSAVAPELALVAETVARIDTVLPAPARPTPFEDGVTRRPRWQEVFRARQRTYDLETVVLLEARDRGELDAAVDVLARAHPWLGDWPRRARGALGFVLAGAGVAAWVRGETGAEGYAPDHTLVHGLARLLVTRRFGALPHWIHVGLAWDAERSVLGCLVASPYRADMLVDVDYAGWGDELRTTFRKRRRTPLRLEELAGWEDGTFDREVAASAWGLTRFLVEEHGERLPSALDHLAALYFEKGRVPRDDGGWDWIPGFQPSAADQRAVLEERVAPDLLEEASRRFRSGFR